VSASTERSYRRVLRLLPAGYRQQWEEDKLTALMQTSGASRRPSLAQRLSVVTLALRVRLQGTHASPRGQIWYQAVHGIALMVLLYQSVAITALVKQRVGFEVVMGGTGLLQAPDFDYLVWYPVFGLLWIAAFACYVLGRVSTARVLAVLALVTTAGSYAVLDIIVFRDTGQALASPPSDLSRWSWLVVSTAVVFVNAHDVRPSRLFWIGAYAIGSVALILAPYGKQVGRVDLSNLTTAALVVAMFVALGRSVLGRGPSPSRWLLALAAFAGGIGGVRLALAAVRWQPVDPFGNLRDTDRLVQAMLGDVTLVGLALACALVGVLALRRAPKLS
jgi:hypothetical protein